MDVGCSQCGFGASTMTFQHHSGLATSIVLKSTPHLHKCNSVGVQSYAHQQHIKVLTHFVYIWNGCLMQSMWVSSLKHDFTTSFGPGMT